MPVDSRIPLTAVLPQPSNWRERGIQMQDALQMRDYRTQIMDERKLEMDERKDVREKARRIEAVMQQHKDDPRAGIEAAMDIDWDIGNRMLQEYEKAQQERQIRVTTQTNADLDRRQKEGGLIAQALMGLRDPQTGQWVPERLGTVRSVLEQAALRPAWLPKEWDPETTPQLIEGAIRAVESTRKEIDAEIKRRSELVALDPTKNYYRQGDVDALATGGAPPAPGAPGTPAPGGAPTGMTAPPGTEQPPALPPSPSQGPPGLPPPVIPASRSESKPGTLEYYMETFAKSRGKNSAYDLTPQEQELARKLWNQADDKTGDAMNQWRRVQAFDRVAGRAERSPLVRAYDRTIVLRRTIDNIERDPGNSAMQMNLAYGYVQALDTYMSAVREGELRNLNTIDSKIGSFKNEVEQMTKGQIVRPEVAKQIAAAAKEIIDAIEEGKNQKMREFGAQASAAGVRDMWDTYTAEAFGPPTPRKETGPPAALKSFLDSQKFEPGKGKRIKDRAGNDHGVWAKNADGSYTKVSE